MLSLFPLYPPCPPQLRRICLLTCPPLIARVSTHFFRYTFGILSTITIVVEMITVRMVTRVSRLLRSRLMQWLVDPEMPTTKCSK